MTEEPIVTTSAKPGDPIVAIAITDFYRDGWNAAIEAAAKICEERMMAEGDEGEWLANVELRGAADEIRRLAKGAGDT